MISLQVRRNTWFSYLQASLVAVNSLLFTDLAGSEFHETKSMSTKINNRMQSANTGRFYSKSLLRHSALIRPAYLDIPLWRWKIWIWKESSWNHLNGIKAGLLLRRVEQPRALAFESEPDVDQSSREPIRWTDLTTWANYMWGNSGWSISRIFLSFFFLFLFFSLF